MNACIHMPIRPAVVVESYFYFHSSSLFSSFCILFRCCYFPLHFTFLTTYQLLLARPTTRLALAPSRCCRQVCCYSSSSCFAWILSMHCWLTSWLLLFVTFHILVKDRKWVGMSGPTVEFCVYCTTDPLNRLDSCRFSYKLVNLSQQTVLCLMSCLFCSTRTRPVCNDNQQHHSNGQDTMDDAT